jgi:hypothetical protein
MPKSNTKIPPTQQHPASNAVRKGWPNMLVLSCVGGVLWELPGLSGVSSSVSVGGAEGGVDEEDEEEEDGTDGGCLGFLMGRLRGVFGCFGDFAIYYRWL